MTRKTKSPPVPWSYILSAAAAVLFSWLLHELAHWYTGELLGNEMTMSLNSSGPVAGHYDGRWHYMIVSAAGPLVTLLIAFVMYRVLRKTGDEHLFPVLVTCVYMRALAGVMNFIRLNDEGRISAELGLGTFTISIAVVGVMGWWMVSVIKARKFTLRRVIGTVLLVMLFSSILILADRFLRVRII